MLAGAVCPLSTATAQDDYELIFSDEFNLPDGSRPDPAKWHSCTRHHSTWNRWISDTLAVAFVKGGHLVCRAIPNPDGSNDATPMLTGAVETSGLFSFTYGKVEVRLRTNLHDGNFPAAWMMPQPPCDGWPRAGEIDIFESIDGRKTSFHTIHSHWTYDLGNKTNPVHAFNRPTTVNQWHIYGLLWTPDSITWTVDGEAVGTYPRSTDPEAMANGQWPFDHPFYLILNQSVGDGSWAKNAETNYTYETHFDWIRVYQKRNGDDGIRAVTRQDTSWPTQTDSMFDLCGRRMDRRVQKGVYLLAGRKVAVR